MSVYYFGSIQDMPVEAKTEVEAFLQNGPCTSGPSGNGVTLATNQAGGVHLTLMGFLQGANLSELFMQTNCQSQKVKNIQSDGHVEISVSSGQGGVILSCRAEVLEDEQTKADKWEPWFAEYHPTGATSPDYVVLRFVPEAIRSIL